MNDEEAEEYTSALGLIAEGAYRKVALGIKLGVPKSLGLKRDELVARIRTIKMSQIERQEAVKELAANWGAGPCHLCRSEEGRFTPALVLL